MQNSNDGKQPHLNHVRRQKMIEQCKKWTAKEGPFPTDYGTDFYNMTNRELLDYHSCYEWALNEKNFRNFMLSNKKGG